MVLLFSILAACLGAISLAGVGTLVFLLLAAALAGRRAPSPAVAASPLRLAIIVPAHNEELMLAQTLQSLRAQDFPRECYEIVVVADNCSDRTAEVARACGVTVLERISADERAKGYALNFANFSASIPPCCPRWISHCRCRHLGQPKLFGLHEREAGVRSARRPRRVAVPATAC